jgi:hypothetical protein
MRYASGTYNQWKERLPRHVQKLDHVAFLPLCDPKDVRALVV